MEVKSKQVCFCITNFTDWGPCACGVKGGWEVWLRIDPPEVNDAADGSLAAHVCEGEAGALADDAILVLQHRHQLILDALRLLACRCTELSACLCRSLLC